MDVKLHQANPTPRNYPLPSDAPFKHNQFTLTPTWDRMEDSIVRDLKPELSHERGPSTPTQHLLANVIQEQSISAELQTLPQTELREFAYELAGYVLHDDDWTVNEVYYASRVLTKIQKDIPATVPSRW